MKYEIMIEKIFRKYFETQGYIFSNDDLRELIDVYLDCQEWDDEKLLTGLTENEIMDWVKHTSEVVRLIDKNERYIGVKEMIFNYMEMSRTMRKISPKSAFEIDIAG